MSDARAAWDKLKLCKPVLSPNVEFESSRVRNEQWLVLRNRVNGDHVRLNESASKLISKIDGTRSLEQLLNDSQLTVDSPQALTELLTPLCVSGIVSLGSAHEDARLLHQHRMQSKVKRKRKFGNPLAIRFPLHNPDQWLSRLVNKLNFVLTRGLVWSLVAIIVFAAITAVANLDVLASTFRRVAESPVHWWLYALLYPALKAIHELAHAVVIKHFGGAVHETGITLLVLMPIPYVDASDAWLFPSKAQRILVSAAGMMAECTIAAFGLFTFLLVQPGFLQEFGFALFVLGSISTILFNANPLLKFDGYYILQDWLDMPNLGPRSGKFCQYLAKKYLFKLPTVSSPVTGSGEQPWLLAYGVLSVAYRFFITMVIALFLASQYMLLGAALALFALFQLLVKPVIKLQEYLRTSAELAGIRRRAITITVCGSIVCALVVALMPLPSSTRAEGVVWVPTQAQVFAPQEGVIEQLLVQPGDIVSAGQLLMRMHEPQLQTRLQVVQSELSAARVDYRALQRTDRVKAQAFLADIQSLASDEERLQQRLAKLEIRADGGGQFVVDKNNVLIGRRAKQGELLAYVVNKQELMVKAVLTQQRMERLQAGVISAQVRLADRFSEAVNATLTRQTPAGSNSLPSPALAYDGRSGIAVASQTDDELQTLESVFHIELELPRLAGIAGIGGRAYVTLNHQPESLGKRWWRSTRQLLLKRLTV